MLARRYDLATQQLRAAVALDSNFYYARWALGGILFLQNRIAEARGEFEKATSLSDDPLARAWLAAAHARLGDA